LGQALLEANGPVSDPGAGRLLAEIAALAAGQRTSATALRLVLSKVESLVRQWPNEELKQRAAGLLRDATAAGRGREQQLESWRRLHALVSGAIAQEEEAAPPSSRRQTTGPARGISLATLRTNPLTTLVALKLLSSLVAGLIYFYSQRKAATSSTITSTHEKDEKITPSVSKQKYSFHVLSEEWGKKYNKFLASNESGEIELELDSAATAENISPLILSKIKLSDDFTRLTDGKTRKMFFFKQNSSAELVGDGENFLQNSEKTDFFYSYGTVCGISTFCELLANHNKTSITEDEENKKYIEFKTDEEKKLYGKFELSGKTDKKIILEPADLKTILCLTEIKYPQNSSQKESFFLGEDTYLTIDRIGEIQDSFDKLFDRLHLEISIIPGVLPRSNIKMIQSKPMIVEFSIFNEGDVKEAYGSKSWKLYSTGFENSPSRFLGSEEHIDGKTKSFSLNQEQFEKIAALAKKKPISTLFSNKFSLATIYKESVLK
jgi:hypothetical protein